MTGWTEILQNVKQRHSFLTQLEVCGSANYSSPLPDTLQVSFDIAESMLCSEPDVRHLAMVFPILLDCPEWIAVGCSLAAIKRDFLPNIESMTSFTPGQKLLLDNKHVVQYVSEERWEGTRFIKVNIGAKQKTGQGSANTTKLFRIDDRLRFQPTETPKRLSLIENINSQSDHLIDRLLGIGSFGNRSLFTNKVVLVSRLTKVRRFVEKTHIVNSISQKQSVTLRDLFQWGGISVEGELEQWGHQQIDAEPVIGVAPDLITLREYLFNRQSSDVLIILDGHIPFVNDLQALDEILDKGYPIIALMENRHLDDLKHLEDRRFRTWVWSEHDLQQIELSTNTDISNRQLPFNHFHRSVQNYYSRQITKITCDCSELVSAAEKLQTFSKQCRTADPETRIVEHRFYHCLLRLSRLLRPFGVRNEVSRDRILKDLEQVLSDIDSKVTKFEKEAVDTAHVFVDMIKTLLEIPNGIFGKVIELEKLFLNKTRRRQQCALVLADASEVPLTESYWKETVLIGNPQRFHFVTSSELHIEQNYDHLILCGWLGTEQMLKLFDSCIAPSISVFVYPFEQEWFRSAESRWRRQKENIKKAELTQHQKAEILQTQPENLISASQEPTSENPYDSYFETDFDITDFELSLHTYRRDLYRRPSAPGETEIEARFVGFTEQRYAYLRQNYKVPVVTDFIAGHADESASIPSKDVAQLNVGDYVVFREGSDSDLLRDLADRGLARVGKSEHRKIAGLWKQALMQFVTEHQFGFEGALIELWDAGLQRTEITFRSWLNDDHRIGPQNENDIEIIAKVSRNRELQEHLEYVRRAIREVRGAHLQAAHFLTQKFIAQVPSMLQHGLAESHSIEIEDIGQAFVVRIEFIDDEDVGVPITKVNRLFKDDY